MKTVGSLFSGIGGFDLGLERAGFEIAWQCDNDPFCNRVLEAHWPEVRRYGDVRDINAVGRADEAHPFRSGDSANSLDIGRQGRAADAVRPNLIVGGFPCQDLSVAGKRAGLDGARSSLWFEFHRILSELRPTYCLIENVPGLLSSNSGRDFGIVLSGLAELWPAVGWAILDSRFFGVPQRRRRVYIVGGPSRERVAQILSLCEGGDWHTAPRRASREDIANPLGASATSFGGQRFDLDHETYIPELAHTVDTHSGAISQREDQSTLVAATLHARDHKGVNAGHGKNNFVITHPLRADGFDASEDGTGRGTPLVFTERTRADGRNFESQEELSYALTNPGSGGRTHSRQLYDGYGVRRLTPVECERLQGFPDGWTDIGGTADGPRYKALGNAVTVPVIEYIGRRLMEVL